MNIPPLNLASDPSKTIHMREATVAETLQFSDVDPSKEEAVTTLFLNTVQLPEYYSDSTEWTADDRRLMLLWYYIHTQENNTSLKVKYNCDCGDEHSAAIELLSFTRRYTPIQGKPYREAADPVTGEKIIVRPFTGKILEEMELIKSDMEDLDPDTGEYQGKLARLILLSVVLCFEYPDREAITDKPDKIKARKEREKAVRAMPFTKYQALQEVIWEKQKEMNHGLPTEIANGVVYLISEPQVCPKDKEIKTHLRLRFRGVNYIPGL